MTDEILKSFKHRPDNHFLIIGILWLLFGLSKLGMLISFTGSLVDFFLSTLFLLIGVLGILRYRMDSKLPYLRFSKEYLAINQGFYYQKILWEDILNVNSSDTKITLKIKANKRVKRTIIHLKLLIESEQSEIIPTIESFKSLNKSL